MDALFKAHKYIVLGIIEELSLHFTILALLFLIIQDYTVWIRNPSILRLFSQYRYHEMTLLFLKISSLLSMILLNYKISTQRNVMMQFQ